MYLPFNVELDIKDEVVQLPEPSHETEILPFEQIRSYFGPSSVLKM